MQDPSPSIPLLLRVEQLLLNDLHGASDQLLEERASLSTTRAAESDLVQVQHLEDVQGKLTQQVVKLHALRAQLGRKAGIAASSAAPGLGPAWHQLSQRYSKADSQGLQEAQELWLVDASAYQAGAQGGAERDQDEGNPDDTSPAADQAPTQKQAPSAGDLLTVPPIPARPPPRAAPAHMMPPLVPTRSITPQLPDLQSTTSLQPQLGPTLLNIPSEGHMNHLALLPPDAHNTSSVIPVDRGHAAPLGPMDVGAIAWASMGMLGGFEMQGVKTAGLPMEFAAHWLPPQIMSELFRLHAQEGMHPMAAVELLLSRVLVTPHVADGMLMWAMQMQHALQSQHSGPGPPPHSMPTLPAPPRPPPAPPAPPAQQLQQPAAGMLANTDGVDGTGTATGDSRAPIFAIDREENRHWKRRHIEQEQTQGQDEKHAAKDTASGSVQAGVQPAVKLGIIQQIKARLATPRPVPPTAQPPLQQAQALQQQQQQQQQQPVGMRPPPPQAPQASQQQQQQQQQQGAGRPLPSDRQQNVARDAQSQQNDVGIAMEGQQQQQQQQPQSSVPALQQQQQGRKHPQIQAPAAKLGARSTNTTATETAEALPPLQPWRPMLISECTLRTPLKETSLLQEGVMHRLAHSAPGWCVVMSYSVYDGVVMSQVTSQQLLQLWSDGLLHVQTLLLGTQQQLSSRPPAELFRPLAFLACAELCGQPYQPVAVHNKQVVAPPPGWCCPPCLLSIKPAPVSLQGGCMQVLDAAPFWMLLESYDESGGWHTAGSCSTPQQARGWLSSAVEPDFMPCLPMAAAMPPRFWAPTSLFLPLAALASISQQQQRMLRGLTSGELASINYDNRYAACTAVRV